jgi:hypothetical protein
MVRTSNGRIRFAGDALVIMVRAFGEAFALVAVWVRQASGAAIR